MEFNRKEYNSVILAAILHDIGKVVQGSNYYTNCPKDFSSHYGIGKRLINDLFKQNTFKLKDNEIDKNLVTELIDNHHDKQITKNTDKLGDKINLAHIVSISDSYSAKERGDNKETKQDNRETKQNSSKGRLYSLLISVFSQILDGKGDWYYKINRLHYNYKEILPINKENTKDIKDDYTYIIDEFVKNIEKLENANFYSYLYSIQGLMEEYFWSVPSVTINEINDISLYDHSITSCAIASTLYKYHFEKNSLNDINAIRDEQTEKFLIIAGDITGIQNFIFDINTINPRKLSKELRGRSYFVSLLGNIICLKILNELDLPYTNKIIDAGGKFWILAPNTENTIQILDKVYEEIMNTIINELYCSVIPVLNYSVSFKAEDFSYKNLPGVIKRVESKLAEEKLKKFHKSSFKNFKMQNMYDELLKTGICSMCKNNPKKEEENQDYCKICDLCISLGEKITKSKYIIYKKNASNKLLFGYDIEFSNEIDKSALLIEQIDDFDDIKSKLKDISNYIPKDIENIIDVKNNLVDKNTLCNYCKNECKSIEEKKQFAYSFLSFQCIATITPYKNKGTSTDHLAIIKGDVDNLGFIFSEGLKQNLTFSRYVYLSRMMNLFFTYYLKEFLKEKYPYIYTIYAGGDDFLFLGPWENVFNMIIDVYEEFNNYVCQNKKIHFSAAINLFRPKEPILQVVKQADDFLDKAKDNDIEKNNIYIFGEIIKINKFKDDVKVIVDKLDKFYKEGVLKTVPLYRYLNYINFYKMFEQTGNIEYIKYDYLWTYDLNRNFSEKKSEKNFEKNKIIKEAKDYIFNLKENAKDYLKIPLFWVLYKNRKIKKED